jgi:hypothetical protein
MSVRIALMLASMAVGLSSMPHARAQNAEAPQLKVGDSWTYTWSGAARKTETRTLKEIADEQHRFVIGGDVPSDAAKQPDEQPRERALTTNRDHNIVSPDPQNPGKARVFKSYEWPLAPGKAWSFPFNSDRFAFTWDVKVQGWESVTVPAGTFKALRLSLQRSGGQAAASEDLWYAPEAKAVVKRVTTYPSAVRRNAVDQSTIELVSLKLN